MLYGWYILPVILFLTLNSCKEKESDLGGTTDVLPQNVMMWAYTNSTITAAWGPVSEATSYTVQLLETLESEKPLQAYTTSSKDFYQFSGLAETKGYFVRVRANVDFNTGEWVYIKNGEVPGRIMPKYGFVTYDFEEPIPEPSNDPELYPNFPEGWETNIGGRKPSYTGVGPTGRQSDVFTSGEWLMNNMYTNSQAAILHKVGNWAAMMNSNAVASLAMDFDLPFGARKFSFIYGAATISNANETTLPINIELTVEYSKDSGATWTKIGDPLLVDDNSIQYFKEYDLDIQGPVRFRISKNASRARPIIDEVAVYF